MSLDLTTLASSPPTDLDDSSLLALTINRSLGSAALLLHRFGGVHGLARADVDALAAARVPKRRALQLQAALELGRRSLVRPLHRGAQLTSPRDAEEAMRARLAAREQEELHVLGFDAHQRVLIEFVAAVGSTTEVRVHPSDVLRPLLREGAHGAMIVHNHPSGIVEPSECDRELTRRIAVACELVGIRLVDHLVVGLAGAFSFAAHGLL